MKVLHQRFRSRLSLAMQIQELEKNIIPAVTDIYNVPLKMNTSITCWQRITWQEYCQCPSTEKLIEEQFVNKCDLLYRAAFARKSAKLVALVAIKNNFPEEKSLFTVTVHWNGMYHSQNADAVRVSVFILFYCKKLFLIIITLCISTYLHCSLTFHFSLVM